MAPGGVGWRLLDVCGEANTPPLIEFGWEFRVPEPGFARVDPLRGRVSGLLQERESETIDPERSGKIPSAQVSIETGQLQKSTECCARPTPLRSMFRRTLRAIFRTPLV